MEIIYKLYDSNIEVREDDVCILFAYNNDYRNNRLYYASDMRLDGSTHGRNHDGTKKNPSQGGEDRVSLLIK